MKRWAGRFAFLGLILGLGGILSAGDPDGQLNGYVIAENGDELKGAKVWVENADTGMKRKVKTNKKGRFRIPRLPIGDYRVSVSRDGYYDYSALARVHAGQTRNLKMVLTPAVLGEEQSNSASKNKN